MDKDFSFCQLKFLKAQVVYIVETGVDYEIMYHSHPQTMCNLIDLELTVQF